MYQLLHNGKVQAMWSWWSEISWWTSYWIPKKHKRFSPLNQMCHDSKLHSSKTIIAKLRKQNVCKRQAIKFSNSALKINVFTCLIRHWWRNTLKSFGVKDCKAKQEEKSSDLGLVFGCEFLPWEQQDRAVEFLEWQHTGTADWAKSHKWSVGSTLQLADWSLLHQML